MLLGRATHTAVFEPERFQLDYALWHGDRRGKAYKEFAEEATQQGRSILKETEQDTALAIKTPLRTPLKWQGSWNRVIQKFLCSGITRPLAWHARGALTG